MCTPYSINGYDLFIVIKGTDHDALQEELAKLRLLEEITLAESENGEERSVEGYDVVS